MRKNLPLIGVLVGALILLGVLFWFIRERRVSPEAGKPTPTPPAVLLEERPYVTLTPRADGHEFKLEIEKIKDTKTVEYELVYWAGEISRGVIGSVDLEGKDSFTRDLLLGSCSRNVCKYDEGVSEGILTLRLRGASGSQKYEVAFHLQGGSEAKKGLTSQDGNFTFQGTLPATAFYLTSSTISLPKIPQGKIVGGPYGIFTTSSKTAKGTIKLRLTEPSQIIKILGWDGTAWKEYTKGFETDGQVVSVEVDRLTTFIAVAP